MIDVIPNLHFFSFVRNVCRVATADNYFNCQGVYKFNLCNQLLKINFDDCDRQLFKHVFQGLSL